MKFPDVYSVQERGHGARYRLYTPPEAGAADTEFGCRIHEDHRLWMEYLTFAPL